jgi:crossover junction endodeoxyribonuclease RuvC
MKLFDPVGLDLSLTSTGVAVGDVTAAVSVTATGAERLALLRDKILDLVRSVEQPFVLVEGYSFASRNSQAHALGELGGVVRVSLWEQGIPYVEVPPTVRAKFACGRGNASKAEVISAVSARTGIVWDGKGADDQCDAWILQEIGFVHQGNARFSWPASHCEALEKMRWPS